MDRLTTIPEGDPVLNKYRTTINGMKTTLKLSDADAEAYEGDLEKVSGSSEDPQAEEVARDEERNEEQASGDAAVAKARKTTSNKARTTQSDKA